MNDLIKADWGHPITVIDNDHRKLLKFEIGDSNHCRVIITLDDNKLVYTACITVDGVPVDIKASNQRDDIVEFVREHKIFKRINHENVEQPYMSVDTFIKIHNLLKNNDNVKCRFHHNNQYGIKAVTVFNHTEGEQIIWSTAGNGETLVVKQARGDENYKLVIRDICIEYFIQHVVYPLSVNKFDVYVTLRNVQNLLVTKGVDMYSFNISDDEEMIYIDFFVNDEYDCNRIVICDTYIKCNKKTYFFDNVSNSFSRVIELLSADIDSIISE